MNMKRSRKSFWQGFGTIFFVPIIVVVFLGFQSGFPTVIELQSLVEKPHIYYCILNLTVWIAGCITFGWFVQWLDE